LFTGKGVQGPGYSHTDKSLSLSHGKGYAVAEKGVCEQLKVIHKMLIMNALRLTTEERPAKINNSSLKEQAFETRRPQDNPG